MRISFGDGRVLVWGVPVLAEAGALARSVVFAWAIGADELGRAMILALALRMVEMATDVGVERFILQAPDGDTKGMQAGLQGVAIMRGGVAALVILALSPCLAWMFDDGPTAASFAALALCPLLNGFAHLDYRRAQRHFRYGQMALAEAGATLAMLVGLVPAIAVLGNHRAMAAVLIIQVGTRMVLSHLVAKRQYEVQFCTKTLLRSWHFGAPLILNAGLLFLAFYADRLIVAEAYDWATLALYGVAMQLAILPAQIVGRAAVSLVLPTLRMALEEGRLSAVWPRILVTHMVLAAAMVVGFTLLAPTMIDLVYGSELRPSLWLTFALAIAAASIILRTPYSQLSITTGRTGDPARANMVRVITVGLAGSFALAGLPLEAIAIAAAAGEVGATLRAVHLVGLARPLEKRVMI